MSSSTAHGEVHWGYDGEQGPKHWGELSPEFAPCGKGRQQSPVDIPAGTGTNLPDIKFRYQPTALNIVNNGHNIMVHVDKGSFIEVEGKKYHLIQFYYHAPSEHTLGSRPYEMEGHFKHQSDDGDIALVGIFLTKGEENAAYTTMWKHMPTQEGPVKTIEDVMVNPIDLIPTVRTYYEYDGSTTTPPCTEGVKWYILATPVKLSGAQISAFEAIYDHNNRPVQPLNDRVFRVKPIKVMEH
jgi:carbonic anhydrase